MKWRPLRCVFLLFLASCANAVSLPEYREPVRADTTRLASLLDQLCQTYQLTGASAALLLPDGRHWTGTCGMAAAEEPVRPDHLFEIGSITKAYTAALVLDLVRDGRLELDAPVAPLLPGLPYLDGVTVRHLLQHTSGLYDVTDHPQNLPAMLADFTRVWTARDLIERFGGEPVFAPGAQWDYSNTNYHLLGLIVEAVTERPFHAVLRARVLDLQAMRHTFYGGVEVAATPQAHGFMDLNGDGTPEDYTALVPNTAFRTAAGAAGALLATASDVAHWLRAHACGERLEETLYRELTSWRPRGDGMDYGLGLIRQQRGVLEVVGHEGNTAGFSAAAWHAPENDVTVVILTNAHLLRVTPIAMALLETVTGSIAAQLREAMAKGGAEAVVETYRGLKQTYPSGHFFEGLLNELGYELLRAKRVAEAIPIFALNVQEYPEAPNPYDSLGEVYEAAGQIEEARKNYARAVERAEAAGHPNLAAYRANLERVSKR